MSSFRTLAPFLILFAPLGCDRGSPEDESSQGAVGGKADGAALDPFSCRFNDAGDGRIENLEMEVLGASLTPSGTGYELALEIRDLVSGDASVLRLGEDAQAFVPTVSVTQLAAAYVVRAEESPFFEVSVELNSIDGVTYDDSDSLGLRIETFFLPIVCERSPGNELTADERLTAHVAANFDEVLDAGAKELGVSVDDLDADLDSLQCHAVGGHSLPGTDGVGPGTCTVAGLSVLFAINVGMYEGDIVYSMTPIVCEDDLCPGDDAAEETECCRVCDNSQACGDSCISSEATCSQEPGCACQG